MASPIYLDYAAATPVHPEVVSAMQPFFSEIFANPSAIYSSGLAAQKVLESARVDVAQLLGVSPQTIIFTAGATESIAIAVDGVLAMQPGGHIITLAIEHEAVLAAVSGYDHSVVPVARDGIANVKDVVAAVNDDSVLISVMYANNEIGTIQNLSEISAAVAEMRKQRQAAGNKRPLLLHTDASQVASFLHVNAPRLGVDLMTLNGGKAYGPKQSGILYINRDVVLAPYLPGGGQERGLRSGTENLAAAVGFSRSLQLAQLRRKDEQARIKNLRDDLQQQLQSALPNITINGSQRKRLANSLNITVPGLDGERAVMELDEAGLQIATGSACSASSDKPSHVLKAIGLSDAEASASLRITLGYYTTKQQIDRAAEILIRTLK